MISNDFAVFIISHGRPNNVMTLKTLGSYGYTGKSFVILDDLDKTYGDYVKNFGKDKIIVFDKQRIADTTDQGDNFNNLRTTTHARNACFDIAEKIGIKYFLVLDDDYPQFQYRFNSNFSYEIKEARQLDLIFSAILEFFKSTTIKSIAFAQGGDFIGGAESSYASKIMLKRKCMNSFFCSVDRPIKFISRLNEDVNTYISRGVVGDIFFTTNQVLLVQAQTQSSAGGMTEAYLESGTYVKSFYSVMYQPSSVVVSVLKDRLSPRLHHRVTWKNTVPMIVRESIKKSTQISG